MKKVIETVGGWAWWCRQIAEANPGIVLDYPALMQKYIVGTPWEKAL